MRSCLLDRGILTSQDLHIPEPVRAEEILLVRQAAYLEKMINGTLSDQEMRRIGLPWSTELVRRSLRSISGTITACRTALQAGAAINLGGGTHRAHPGFGSGYCLLNDCAIAARTIQFEDFAQKVLILDCDVHQGEGSSDEAQLHAIEAGLACIFDQFQAELVIYLADADPYFNNHIGRLALTIDGLEQRDRLVISYYLEAGIPLALVIACDYARSIDNTVEIHLNTIRLIAQMADGYSN